MTIIVERKHTRVDEMSARDVWNALRAEPSAVLVDVRTQPEWAFSGKPDLGGIDRKVIFVPWKTWPAMAINLGFIADLEEKFPDALPKRFFFMCRSGPRAVSAAQEFARQMSARGADLHCTNVMHGFEGEKNADGQRGSVNGWKAEGLPWTQE